MNRVFLTGNLGADAELRTTNSGTSILVLRLATSEKWTKDGEKKERTDWHMCELWGSRGEKLEQYLGKGTKIAIEGKIRYSSYEDRDGNKRYKTTIAIDEIELLGGDRRAPREDPSDPPRQPQSATHYGVDGKPLDKNWNPIDSPDAAVDNLPF